jgi:hypothetical protein
MPAVFTRLFPRCPPPCAFKCHPGSIPRPLVFQTVWSFTNNPGRALSIAEQGICNCDNILSPALTRFLAVFPCLLHSRDRPRSGRPALPTAYPNHIWFVQNKSDQFFGLRDFIFLSEIYSGDAPFHAYFYFFHSSCAPPIPG